MLHIENVTFEWELGSNHSPSVKEGLYSHPNFTQLQFLPLLFAKENEGVVVTDLPDHTYLQKLEDLGFSLPSLHLFEEELLPYTDVKSWGWSKSIETWAKKRNLRYTPPAHPIIREMASKAFAFQIGEKLKDSALFYTLEEIEAWLQQESYPKVLKTCYGYGGRKRFLLHSFDCFQAIKRTIKSFPLIGQPWVKRTLDFSTQWLIKKDQTFSYLGPTILQNNKWGGYEKTLVGDEQKLFGKHLPFLKTHKNAVEPVIKMMAEKGVTGHLGIDAMVYLTPSLEEKLQPILEINLRKTMGYIALKFLEKNPTATLLALSYINSDEEGLLPKSLKIQKNKKISFPKQLKVDILE